SGGHDPVRNRLLHVLQGLAGEQRPCGIGVHEAGRDADLQAGGAVHRHMSYIASSNKRRKSAAVHGLGLVWWQMSATAISTRRASCSRLTPCAPSLPVMPTRPFSARNQGTNSLPPESLQTCASSSNFSGTASQ